jgi:hypothetical protein
MTTPAIGTSARELERAGGMGAKFRDEPPANRQNGEWPQGGEKRHGAAEPQPKPFGNDPWPQGGEKRRKEEKVLGMQQPKSSRERTIRQYSSEKKEGPFILSDLCASCASLWPCS